MPEFGYYVTGLVKFHGGGPVVAAKRLIVYGKALQMHGAVVIIDNDRRLVSGTMFGSVPIPALLVGIRPGHASIYNGWSVDTVPFVVVNPKFAGQAVVNVIAVYAGSFDKVKNYINIYSVILIQMVKRF